MILAMTEPMRRVAALMVLVVAAAGCSSGSDNKTPPPTAAPAPPPSASATRLLTPEGGPVPRGFKPSSVTFVSADHGWAMGDAPCDNPPCTSIVRTRDGGRTWAGIPAPHAAFDSVHGLPSVTEVRFADDLDGWAFNRSLYSTHDGGAHWTLVHVSGDVRRLAATASTVYIFVDRHAATQDNEHSGGLYESPVASDRFRPVRGAAVSSRGNASIWLDLQVRRSKAYLAVTHDPNTQSSLFVVQGTQVTEHKLPCPSDSGTQLPVLAPFFDTSVLLVCGGEPATAMQAKRAFVTANDGANWQALPDPPEIGHVTSIAHSADETFFLSTERSAVFVTRDDGAHWVEAGFGIADDGWSFVGFTTSQQGFALPVDEDKRFIEFTRDGGEHWSAYNFA